MVNRVCIRFHNSQGCHTVVEKRSAGSKEPSRIVEIAQIGSVRRTGCQGTRFLCSDLKVQAKGTEHNWSLHQNDTKHVETAGHKTSCVKTNLFRSHCQPTTATCFLAHIFLGKQIRWAVPDRSLGLAVVAESVSLCCSKSDVGAQTPGDCGRHALRQRVYNEKRNADQCAPAGGESNCHR